LSCDDFPDLRHHVAIYVGPDPDAPLLVGEKDRARLVKSLTKEWTKAREAIGRPELRFHDLRHSGPT
jgi:integrase